MTTAKALEILKHHNVWRRGLVDDPKYTPKEIGEAIDVAIKHLEYVETLSAIESERLFGTQSTTNDKCPNHEER
jgi:hypothetical protein